FSPKTVLGLKDKIRDLTNSLIDNVKDQGGCEFVSAIAEPLPVQVFLKMMGLPLDRQAEYRALVREIVSTAADVDMMGATSRILRIAASMRDTFVQRRDNPQDDLISLLWGAKIDGKPTTMEDMENYGVLLFIAGLDTVINAMGFGVCHLAQDRALQDRLRQNPALIPETVEELLRRYTFIVLPRRVAKDVVFEGVEMKEDERVMLCLAAADLDAKRFSDPERVDPDRENKAHIAFNAGHHRCLGSHLARLELQTLYQEMLARLPPFRLDPNHSPTCHGGNIFGLDSLRLIWDV
ncbi:MAG: cytochrome P450, partial [Rhodospirillaceae bacterium]